MDKRIFTKVVHAGTEVEETTGAIMTPIFQTSTFVQSEPGVHKGYDYTRAGNPTRSAYEKALAELEGAKHGLAFASGLAAEQAIIQILDKGSKILVSDDVYGGTGRLFRKLFTKYGLEFDFIDMTNSDVLEKKITSAIDMIWVETPTNPTMKIADIRKITKLSTKKDIIVVVDNTFATPCFQQPLKLGADIVLHSTTKYIGGHSDLIGGAVMLSNDELFEKIKFVQFAAGAVQSVMDSFLLLRSVKTLAVRMQQHCKNAQAVAEFLETHPKVEKVFFPGLQSDAGHELSKLQMSGNSGMLSFRLSGNYADVVQFLQKLKLFSLAESLGGVESLVNHPEKMTHASVPAELRKQLGITENLIRLSVGIEDQDDLIADLKQAFEK